MPVVALVVTLAGAAGAEPSAPAPAPAATRPAPVTVVTQRLIRDIARGRVPLARFVDERAGLVYIDEQVGLGDRPHRGARELACGPQLASRLRQVTRALHAKLVGPHPTDGLWCRNRPGPPVCEAGNTTEGDSLLRLELRVDPVRGLVLRAVILADDDRGADDEARHDDAVRRARLVDRLAGVCPGP